MKISLNPCGNEKQRVTLAPEDTYEVRGDKVKFTEEIIGFLNELHLTGSILWYHLLDMNLGREPVKWHVVLELPEGTLETVVRKPVR